MSLYTRPAPPSHAPATTSAWHVRQSSSRPAPGALCRPSEQARRPLDGRSGCTCGSQPSPERTALGGSLAAHGARERDDLDVAGPRAPQRGRGRVRGRAARVDVVDEDEPARRGTGGERAADVARGVLRGSGPAGGSPERGSRAARTGQLPARAELAGERLGRVVPARPRRGSAQSRRRSAGRRGRSIDSSTSAAARGSRASEGRAPSRPGRTRARRRRRRPPREPRRTRAAGPSTRRSGGPATPSARRSARSASGRGAGTPRGTARRAERRRVAQTTQR